MLTEGATVRSTIQFGVCTVEIAWCAHVLKMGTNYWLIWNIAHFQKYDLSNGATLVLSI